MKKRFIGILTACSLALVGLAGCGSTAESSTLEPSVPPTSSEETGPKVVSINDVLQFQVEGMTTVLDYENQHVRIENVNLIIDHGTVLYVQSVDGKTLDSIHTLECHVKDEASLEAAGVHSGDIVHVEGVAVTDHGHAILKDAVFEKVKEDPDGGFLYFPGLNRVLFDNLFNRLYHGFMVGADLTLCEAPSYVEVGKESVWKVVFVGEDTNLEEPRNQFPIDLVVPATLGENHVEIINHWLKTSSIIVANPNFDPTKPESAENPSRFDVPTKRDADGKPIYAPVEAYDTFKYLVMYQSYDMFGRFVLDGTGVLYMDYDPNIANSIFKQWSTTLNPEGTEIETYGFGDYVNDMVLLPDDLQFGDIINDKVLTPENGLPYSYIADDSMNLTQACPIDVVAVDPGSADRLNLTLYTYEPKNVVKHICDNLEALALAHADEETGEKAYYYGSDSQEDLQGFMMTIAQVEDFLFLVMTEYDNYVSIAVFSVNRMAIEENNPEEPITGLTAINDWNTHFGLNIMVDEQGQPVVDEQTGEYVTDEFATALPDINECLPADGLLLGTNSVILTATKNFMSMTQVNYILELENDDAFQATVGAFSEALKTAGFTEVRYVAGDETQKVFYNPKTNEALAGIGGGFNKNMQVHVIRITTITFASMFSGEALDAMGILTKAPKAPEAPQA